MPYELKKTVVLVGMMGSGKTAVGTTLARLLDVPFLDSDAEIEVAADRTIAEIFDRDGEAFFRKKETMVLTRLLENERCILSTGGGAFMSECNQAIVSKKGVAVWLRADLEILWSRVKNKNTRPLLRTADPKKTLQNLCVKRNPLYAHADLIVDAKREYSLDMMAKKVIAALLTRPDVLERH